MRRTWDIDGMQPGTEGKGAAADGKDVTCPTKGAVPNAGLGRLVRAWGYSMNGLRAAWRNEAAFRQEIVGILVAVPFALWLPPRWSDSLLLIAVLLVVPLVELLNSAIEALADAVSDEHRPLLGQAKDIGSAAVLVSLGIAALVWCAVLLPGLVT